MEKKRFLGTEIGEEAFFGNYDLQSVFIPKSVTYVGFGAFANCRSLHSAKFEGNCEIEASTFYYCKNLEEIILPETLEEIRAYTFAGCEKLQTIFIPNMVTYIGNSAFYKCMLLNNIIIPEIVEL